MKSTEKKSIFLLGLLSCACIPQASLAQPALQQTGSVLDQEHLPLTQQMSLIESRFNMPVANNLPVADRVSRVESMLNQQNISSPGTLFERIAALKERSDLVQAIKDSDLLLASPTPNSYKTEFFRAMPPGQDLETGKQDDYLANVMTASKNKVLKFERMPIPVYIAPPPESYMQSACMRALADWQAKTRGLISFKETSANDARVRITWQKLGLKGKVNGSPLGAHTLTKWKTTRGGISVFSLISSSPRSLKYKVPPQEIEVNLDLIELRPQDVRFTLTRNILAHEIGHALGMMGHSDDRLDLMYPDTDELSRISRRDVNTLMRLYQRKTDIPL